MIGFGVGLVLPAVSITAMSRVEPHQTGLAAGALSTAHEVGAALGLAVLAAVAAIGADATGAPSPPATRTDSSPPPASRSP